MPDLPLVLVIEDEYLVLSDLEAALAGGGFTTHSVASGEDALSLVMEGSRIYKALVTDVRLGSDGMSGWEVARRIREKVPSIPVIYVTGSTAEDWAAHGVPDSILVPKPFAPAQLVSALSKFLHIGSAPKR